MALISNPKKTLTASGINVFLGDVIRGLTQTNAFLIAAQMAGHANTVDAELHKIAGKYARRIERYAKTLAPVDTGTLRDSISAEEVGPGVWVVGPEVPYAHILEFGSVYQPPQPYMLPALDRYEPQFIEACRKAAGEF